MNKYPEYESAATPLKKEWDFKLKIEAQCDLNVY